MKNKIVIKTTYIGEDKAHIKKGDIMHICFLKRDLLMGYMNVNDARHLNKLDQLSLLNYLRQKVECISQKGSVFY